MKKTSSTQPECCTEVGHFMFLRVPDTYVVSSAGSETVGHRKYIIQKQSN